MSYHVTIPVEFTNPPAEVYEALADLARWPEWVDNLLSMSPAERMQIGHRFTTETKILGRVNRSDVVVREMVPSRRIVIQSQSGLVDFKTEYHLAELETGCRLTIHVQLSFSQGVFNLARPVAEATAEAKIRANLERLSSLMAARTHSA